MTATQPELVRNEAMEAWLRKRGVKFSGPKLVPLDQIDRKLSRGNQAREEAIDPETVERYVQTVRAGEPMPPCVVIRRGNAYELRDGNHRDEAAVKAKAAALACYELDPKTPTELLDLVTAGANKFNGKPVSAEHRSRQAVLLMADGWAEDVVAEDLQLTVQQVRDAVRTARAGNRAARLGIGVGFDRLAPSSRRALGAVKSDPVFISASKMVIETAWGAGAELNAFVRDVKNAASEADAMALVEKVGNERRAHLEEVKKLGNRKRIPVRSVKHQLSVALGQVGALDPDEVSRHVHEDWEREEFRNRIAEAAIKLMELEENLR